MNKARRAPYTNWYLAFAEWRSGIQNANSEWRTVKFFRQSRNHTIIWTTVMRGHYLGLPPLVKECIKTVTCSRVTAHKIIVTAQAKGYFILRAAADDHRKKLVLPSDRCIADYQAMVDVFLRLVDILRPQPAARRKTVRRK
jgi:hypothetical protein